MLFYMKAVTKWTYTDLIKMVNMTYSKFVLALFIWPLDLCVTIIFICVLSALFASHVISKIKSDNIPPLSLQHTHTHPPSLSLSHTYTLSHFLVHSHTYFLSHIDLIVHKYNCNNNSIYLYILCTCGCILMAKLIVVCYRKG